MKHTAIIKSLALAAVALGLYSCSPESDNDKNDNVDWDWVALNENYYANAALETDKDGSPYYEKIVPVWNEGASILMHYFNDRALTAGNLRPYLTSTVSAKYELALADGTALENSYSNTDSVLTTKVSALVEGWAIALTNMHVGDSVKVVIPAAQGYGAYAHGSVPAYSTLVFNIKLVDVPAYEVP